MTAASEVRRRFASVCEQLSRHPLVREVSERVEPSVCSLDVPGGSRFGQTAVLEAYVDAELKDGRGLTWWLELNHDSSEWIISYSVLETTSLGQDAIREYEDLRAPDLDACVSHLLTAADDLCCSLSILDTPPA